MSRDEYIAAHRYTLAGLILEAFSRAQNASGGPPPLFLRGLFERIDAMLVVAFDAAKEAAKVPPARAGKDDASLPFGGGPGKRA